MNKFTKSILAVVVVLGLGSCTEDPNSPGLEYMPDMYRSPAIEAYVDYGMDPYHFTVDSAVAQRNTPSAMTPVAGTISQSSMAMSLSMPYPYPNTDEGYEAAGTELTSPLPTTKANIERGKEIYEIMCIHCHGEKGEGNGAIGLNHIKGIPSYSGKLKDLPEGKIFHSIHWGKGLMGSHASQIDKKERWQVAQYVQVLQKGGEMPEFDESGNVMAAAPASASE